MRKPITDGIDDSATMRMPNGIQNHTVAMAAVVSIDAVGTTPIRPLVPRRGTAFAIGSRGGAGRTSVATAMP
ncbi:hypothetical protein nbrc107697_21340 [Gordonia crocea]|uniref:Uncharacterized protein n=1 Tax=Gordonia crocea TaxID=589162 RepID=A0A7I9UYB6_9ACTN|nr:hypothetical protein nbrc107697_21340 [Gordonia crocea]